MIDLSFLTEQEHEAIMKVLQRDAALKRVDEERVRHLPEKIKDDQQLKNMSGQWFYEAKSKRHRDRIHGTDIIRASMRKKRLQVAELTGVVEELEEDVAPASPSSSWANPAPTMIDMSREHTRKLAVSPAKQRKNPFNSSQLPDDHLSQHTKNEQWFPKNGRTGFFQTSKEGALSQSKEKLSVLDISSQKSEEPKQIFPSPENGSQIKAPIPKARKMIYKAHDSKQDGHQPFPRQSADSLHPRGAPRGILKRNSSSSSTDSETVRFPQNFEPKSKIVSPGLTIHERISEKEHSLEDDSSSNSLEPLKHVRFSAVQDEPQQSPGLIHGHEVGEFSVLESDRLKNGTEDGGDIDEFWGDPKPSQNRKPLSSRQSALSPRASQSEAHQPTSSDSSPINGYHSPSEVLTTRPPSIENLLTISEYKAKSSELSRLESELSKSPADELPCVEPEPPQVPDCSSRDHQQGKPLLLQALKAKTSSRSGPHTTEIRKTTDDSISKVLDWFNRSSHSDDNESLLQHPHRVEPKEKTDSKPQIAIALVTDDTSLKGDDAKAPLSTKVESTSVGSESALQVEGNMLPSENCQDNNVNIKPKSINLSRQGQGKECPGTLQAFEICSPNQGIKPMDSSQTDNTEGNGVLPPASNYSYSALKGSDAEDQLLSNSKDVGSLDEDEPKLHVYEKKRENSKLNFDSSMTDKEPRLKDNMKAERVSEGGDAYIPKALLEPENIVSPPGAANGKPPWKKTEAQLQQDTHELPKYQVQREKYKRVSDRISFWEGEKAAAKLTHKEPIPSCSQRSPSAEAHQPVKPMDSLSSGQSKYNQATAKQVVLHKDGQAAHLSSFYPSNKPKETRPQISGPSKNYPSADQSGKVSLFQNKRHEPIQRLPVADSLHSGRDIALPALRHPSNVGNEIHTPLEKDHSLIGELNPNFKVMALKERMDEPNTEQIYNHSQFENLRKFWDLGANPNSQDNVEKNTTMTNQKKYVPFSSQKHKEFSGMTSSEKNVHEVEMLSLQKVPAREEIEKLNSKCTVEVLPDETTFPLRPPGKSAHLLPGNEPSKENVKTNTEWIVTPVFKEEKDYSDQEIQESMVKTSVLPKDYKDTFNDSSQKLLSEASSPAIQPSDGKAHGKPVLEPGGSENRTGSQKTDFANTEEEAKGHKEIINEHVAKTVAPPKFKLDTLTTSLDKLLKEATGTLPSPLQTKLEPVTTSNNSEPEESRVSEKGIEWSHSASVYQKEIKVPFLKGEETLENTVLPPKVQSGECQLNMENLFQMAAEGSHPLDQTCHLHRKGSFEDVATSPQDMPSSSITHLAPQDKALHSQREISETVEKVILPSKPVLEDVNAVLQKLFKEAWLSCPVGREIVPGKVKAEFPEGVQAAGSPPNSLGVIPPWATMNITVPDRKDLYSLRVLPDETQEAGSHLAAQISPSVQMLSSLGLAVAQYGKELPQEVAEIVRETIIQPKSGHDEFSAGLDKLLKETIGTPSLKFESGTGTLSPSKVIGSTEVPRRAAPGFHPEEIQETVKKSEAPSIMETAFDTGFEKLFKETSEAPYFQLQVSVKEGTPEKGPPQSGQASFLGTVPQFFWAASEASEMKLKNVFKPQADQCDKMLGGDKPVTGLSVDLSGSESGVEIPGTPQLCVDHKIGIRGTMKPTEGRDSESEAAGVREGSFREPGFEEFPITISMSRYRQPIPFLMNRESPAKTSGVELILASPCKRQEEEKGFSDSDFSDGNIGSNSGSWRNTSSEHFEVFNLLVNE